MIEPLNIELKSLNILRLNNEDTINEDLLQSISLILNKDVNWNYYTNNILSFTTYNFEFLSKKDVVKLFDRYPNKNVIFENTEDKRGEKRKLFHRETLINGDAIYIPDYINSISGENFKNWCKTQLKKGFVYKSTRSKKAATLLVLKDDIVDKYTKDITVNLSYLINIQSIKKDVDIEFLLHSSFVSFEEIFNKYILINTQDELLNFKKKYSSKLNYKVYKIYTISNKILDSAINDNDNGESILPTNYSYLDYQSNYISFYNNLSNEYKINISIIKENDLLKQVEYENEFTHSTFNHLNRIYKNYLEDNNNNDIYLIIKILSQVKLNTNYFLIKFLIENDISEKKFHFLKLKSNSRLNSYINKIRRIYKDTPYNARYFKGNIKLLHLAKDVINQNKKLSKEEYNDIRNNILVVLNKHTSIKSDDLEILREYFDIYVDVKLNSKYLLEDSKYDNFYEEFYNILNRDANGGSINNSNNINNIEELEEVN